MSLFIANCSKQNFEIHYWVEGSPNKPVVTKIRPGAQENIYPQGNRVDHQRIIDQHRPYGLIPVSEIDRHDGFVGQCYQFDTPIPLDRLQSTMKRNDEDLYAEAQERRKEAAAATDDTVRRAAQESEMKVGNFEVEITEVEQKGVDQTVHEVITVTADAPQETRRRGRPRKS
ncbi:hypothetical protein DM48_370 [Burkholderia gladioli]|uniref:Uncharacterized protein n=1 Tax=Burkholderia gladioli TaxID=28095 RepID=A0AAW3F1K3_BURGA|nr:hypothetical protein [Burkholderia gladioli]KGC13675.1 hypothetical protein DM48_370 [Burkholderia gladioli]